MKIISYFKRHLQKSYLLAFFLVFMLGFNVVYAAVHTLPTNGFEVIKNSYTVIDRFGQCRKVTNNTNTADLFIGTNLQNEWASIYANPALRSDIAVTACDGNPVCANGATNYPTCTTCPTGTFLTGGQCIENPDPGGGGGGAGECIYLGPAPGPRGGFYIQINGHLYHTAGPAVPQCP